MNVVTKPDKLRTSVLHGHKQLLMEKNTTSNQTIVIELESPFISYGHNTGKHFLASYNHTLSPVAGSLGFPAYTYGSRRVVYVMWTWQPIPLPTLANEYSWLTGTNFSSYHNVPITLPAIVSATITVPFNIIYCHRQYHLPGGQKQKRHHNQPPKDI